MELSAHVKYDKGFDAKASATWKKCKDFREDRNSTRDDLVAKETFVTKGDVFYKQLHIAFTCYLLHFVIEISFQYNHYHLDQHWESI